MDARKLWKAFALTLIALAAIAIANQVVPYGWKVFVLAKIFKIAWATSVALGLAAFMAFLFPRIPRGIDFQSAPDASVLVQAIGAVAGALVAFVTLGYLLPDWDPWTEGIGAVVVAVWAILIVAASRAMPSPRQTRD
jgi:hypothetical protein